ncbi:MAG: ABC transporter ATP-binding protein, partial [Verrucomicrobia bacterium]|nr:ABC transporter ATP-binding protein [Verrucomicrobiota bacterium]
LILDEPTIGLDPNQVRSVRQLIKELGKTHTILLSTHILPEVEMTCSRILILHEGKLLAADRKENLEKSLGQEGQVIAEIAAPLLALQECWKEMELIEHYDIAPSEGEYHRCALTPRAGVDIRPLVFEKVRLHGWTMRELKRSSHTLEDIFVHIIRGDKEEGF